MATRRIPVVFIHGLWLSADSWRPWMELFEAAGYETHNPGYPGEASTVEETRAHPERLANQGVEELTEHHARFIRSLGTKPIVIAHSTGGLIAQKLLGMGLASGAVVLSPVQMKGVFRLPLVQLRNVWPFLKSPANRKKAMGQTREQFHRGFASAVSEEESNALHDRFMIPTPVRPVFEGAFANFSPRSAARVDTRNPNRGPLLIIGAGRDGTVPESVARSSFRRYRKASTVNDFKSFPDRGHSISIDHGWREVADTALDWLDQQGLSPEGAARETVTVPLRGRAPTPTRA